MSDWFEDETFWESLDWFLFSQIRTDEITSVEADQIVKLLQPAPGAVILDLTIENRYPRQPWRCSQR